MQMNRRVFAARLKRIEQEYSEMLGRIDELLQRGHDHEYDWYIASKSIERAARSNAVAIIRLERNLKGRN